MSVFIDQAVMTLGWVSAVAGAIAYMLASRGVWDAKSLRFQVTNMSAAGLMIIVGAVNGIWPSVAANMVWVVIGANTILMVFQARRAARHEVSAALDMPLGSTLVDELELTLAEDASNENTIDEPANATDDAPAATSTHTFAETLTEALTGDVHGDASGEFVLEQTPDPADVLLAA